VADGHTLVAALDIARVALALVEAIEASVGGRRGAIHGTGDGIALGHAGLAVGALDKTCVALALGNGVCATVHGRRLTIGGTGNGTALGHAYAVHGVAVVTALADTVAKVTRALVPPPVAHLKVRIGRARVSARPVGQLALFLFLLLWFVQRRRGLKMIRRC
jgi:hypothetical protein